MITEAELRKVDELRRMQHKLTQLINKFNSQYVAVRVGIVDINSSAPNDPKPSEYANFFHNYTKEIMNDLSDQALNRLAERLRSVELELNQYIKPDIPDPSH